MKTTTATVKSGPLRGAQVQVLNWNEHKDMGYYACVILKDFNKAWLSGDQVDLDVCDLEFNK